MDTSRAIPLPDIVRAPPPAAVSAAARLPAPTVSIPVVADGLPYKDLIEACSKLSQYYEGHADQWEPVLDSDVETIRGLVAEKGSM